MSCRVTRSASRLLPLLVAACLLAVSPAASLAAQPADSGQQASLEKGEFAPAFTLPTASGGRLSLSSQRGAPVVLVFFRGTW